MRYFAIGTFSRSFVLKKHFGLLWQIVFKWDYPANICWSSRRIQDVFKSCLEDVFNSSSAFNFSSSGTSWRCIQDVLEHEQFLRWSRLQDVLKTSLEDVLKTCHEDVFKTSRRFTKCLLGVSAPNKSKCVSSKSIFRKSISDDSKENLKCINKNPITSIFVLFWNISSIFVLRIKISEIGHWSSEAIKTKF